MNFSKTNMTALIAAFFMLFGCAVEPEKKLSHGADRNLFKKSDLLGKQAVGSDSSSLSFVGEAMPNKSFPEKVRILSDAANPMGDVSFIIGKDYLTVAEGPQAKPILQYRILGHWDLAPQKTAAGVETQYLVRNATNKAAWQEREYIEVDPTDPLEIKADSDTMRNMYRVAQMEVKDLVYVSRDDMAMMAPSLIAKMVRLHGIKSGQKMRLELTDKHMNVYTVDGGEKILVAQASASFYNLVQRETRNGEKTPDLMRRSVAKNDGAEWVAVDPLAFDIVEPDFDLMHNLWAKADLDGKTFTVGTDAIPVLSDNPALMQELASQAIVPVKNGDKLKAEITENYLSFYKGDQLAVQFKLAGHYDLILDRNSDGTLSSSMVRDTKQNPWQKRAYISADPRDPDSARLSDFLYNYGERVLAKEDLNGCFEMLEITGQLADTLAEMAPEADRVCFDMTQTVLSVTNAATGDLIFTAGVDHVDVDYAITNDRTERTSIIGTHTNNPDWTKRSHVIVALNNPQKVDNRVQPDAMKKSEFAGEFLYTATVVEAHSENGLFFEGWNMQSGDRLEFEFSDGQITAYKVNEILNDSDARSPVLRYRADQFDVRRAENGFGDPTNVIAEFRDKDWEDREFARINFASNMIPGYFNDLLGVQKYYANMVFTSASRKVADVEIEDGYITFVTEEVITPNARAGFIGSSENAFEPTAIKIRHAFMRVGDRGYEPKLYTGHDFNKFGYFRATERGIDPELGKTDATLKHFIQRHDVSNGKQIVYYLSDTWPDDLKDEAQEVIDSWNIAFKQATGRDNVIVLKENSGQHFGDPRYNMLVWIPTRSNNAPLGFGPSVVDPTTGEAISAKSYYYGDSLKWSLRMASKYYDFATGRVTPDGLATQVAGRGQALGGAEGGTNRSISGSRTLVSQLPADQIAGEQLHDTVRGTKPSDLFDNLSRVKQVAPNLSPIASNQGLAKQFAQLENEMKLQDAQADAHSFGGRHQGCLYQPDFTLPSMIKLIEANPEMTKEELLDDLRSRMVYTTMLHEVGHNLGLRHNFFGSFDETNFPAEYHLLKTLNGAGFPDPIQNGEWIYKYRTSSVMDYNDDYEALSKQAGPYDIAAIKFGYGELLESVVGVDDAGALVTEDVSKDTYDEAVETLLAEDDSMSLNRAHAIASQQLRIRPYMFCTDEHVSNNPTCNRFDSGVTVREITENRIGDYDVLYYLYGFRDGRRLFTGNSGYVLSRFIMPMRQLLDEYVYNIIFNAFPNQQGAASQDDYVDAINLSIGFFNQVLGSVEPGTYVLDQETGVFDVGAPQSEEDVVLEITPGQGKYLKSRIETVGNEERVLNRGVEFDKMATLYALSMRGYPASKYIQASLSLSYIDLLRDFTVDTFSAMIRDEMTADVNVAPGEDGTLRLATAEDEQPMTVKIKPSTSLNLQNFATILAAADFNSNADRTFGDYMDHRVAGVDGDFPADVDVVRFTSATGLREYVVPQTQDGQSISFALAAPAADMSTRLIELRDLLPTLPTGEDMQPELIEVFAKGWELGEGEPMPDNILDILTQNLDGNLDVMTGMLTQWFEGAEGDAVKAELEAILGDWQEKLAAYQELAQARSDATDEISDLERELTSIESSLIDMKAIYEIFN